MITDLLSVTRLILSKGNLTTKPLDFNGWRKGSLAGLEKFLPQPLSTKNRTWLKKNPTLFNLVSTAAFIKSSYQKQAGHLVVPQQQLYYVRIPKAGSTSIGSELLKQIHPELSHEKLNATQINFLVDAWLETSVSDNLKSLTGFTVVRHPFARIVSVYRDFFQDQPNRPLIYQNYLGGILQRNITFDAFIERISRIPDRFKDQHLKPQHLFLEPYRKKGLQISVLKLEALQNHQDFFSQYGITINHLNQSDSTAEISCADSTVETIKKMYAFDFEVFSYDHNSRL
ncbi:MAG: sulfotransferase family 2 domain-containing protein [Cyclobacteriaceae bacterium]|nr:sulfotransferase family 2 domain-containing protein [Cyclobacteriaceae bacterium]